MGLNIWCSPNSVSFKSHSISVTFKFCAVLGAQGIHAMWFKLTQGNVHCSKFESGSNTDRMTFETNAICTTSDIQPRISNISSPNKLSLGVLQILISWIERTNIQIFKFYLSMYITIRLITCFSYALMISLEC